MTKDDGFTIIEILVVILLIAIASTWIAIDFYHELDTTQLNSESMRMLRMARYAQMAAGQGRRKTIIHINMNDHCTWLETIEPVQQVKLKKGDTAPTIFEFENVFSEKYYLPENLQFAKIRVNEKDYSSSEQDIEIAFNPDGTADSALIELQSNDRSRTITINGVTSQSELHR